MLAWNERCSNSTFVEQRARLLEVISMEMHAGNRRDTVVLTSQATRI